MIKRDCLFSADREIEEVSTKRPHNRRSLLGAEKVDHENTYFFRI